MFGLRRAMRRIDMAGVDLMPEALAGDLLDRSANSVTNMLDRFRGEEVALEREIVDLTERLRQTRVAIAAFESAGAILDGGKQPAETAPDKKIGRLVPRAVPPAEPSQKAIVHVHTDIRA
jgi:predicted sugar kinase